jgi:uncharacterized protein
VANFGAFVDIGVHQDGLVHVSELADRFVRDPREVVKTGQIVKVRVLELDVPRKRIALSMRSGEVRPVQGRPARNGSDRNGSDRNGSDRAVPRAPARKGGASGSGRTDAPTAMQAAFAALRKR